MEKEKFDIITSIRKCGWEFPKDKEVLAVNIYAGINNHSYICKINRNEWEEYTNEILLRPLMDLD